MQAEHKTTIVLRPAA